MNDAVEKDHHEDAERKQLAGRLRNARKYLGLKQEDVAGHLKVPRTALSDIENGQRRVEAMELMRLAKLYGQQVSYFTGEDASAAALPADVVHIARQVASLSTRDREELGRFAEYLYARAQFSREGFSRGIMDTDYRNAVRNGAMAAGRLHRQLGSRQRVERNGGNIDVFDALAQLGVPLVLRPLEGLLGAYLREPASGVLVTTRRPLSVQRYTAAHELGHFWLNHEPSLDDEDILRRFPFVANQGDDLQEVEADAFAWRFLIPRWLIAWHAKRQGWRADHFAKPHFVYQLSLRLGISFETMRRALQRYKLIASRTAADLEKVRVRNLKEEILGDYMPPDCRRDVWLLTERDANTSISGSWNDFFVLRLEEHSGGGYLWDAGELKRSGFSVVNDVREEMDDRGVGNHTFRRLTAVLEEPKRGRVSLCERRPWQPDQALNRLELAYDLTGPEDKGYSRVERRWVLEAT